MGNIQNSFEISNGKHVMLLYEKNEERGEAAAHWINQALKEDQLCIYASVYAFDNAHISNVPNLSPKIRNYQGYVENNMLQIINSRPYYESALSENLVLFENLKADLEKSLRDLAVKGKKEKITVFADTACCLCENKSFGESELLETWWQKVHDEWIKNDYQITVVCPHPSLILQSNQQTKSNIAYLHDLIIEFNTNELDYSGKPVGQEYDLRILIVESDPDLKTLYTEFLGKLDIDVIVVSEGNECLALVKTNDFDIIILDTYLADNLEPIDVAKEIYRIKPGQRIVLTTTNTVYHASAANNGFELNKEDILVKPFRLSSLLERIRRS